MMRGRFKRSLPWTSIGAWNISLTPCNPVLLLILYFCILYSLEFANLRSELDYSRQPSVKTTGVALRIIILTQQRPESLSRCLHSIRAAYYDQDSIALDIWVDRYQDELPVHRDTLLTSQAFYWPYGPKTLHTREKVMGLAHQWLYTWTESLRNGLHLNTNEKVLILEDDMTVSKYFWRWLKAAHGAYDGRVDIAGVTLQRATLCAARCPPLNGGPVVDGVFLYPLLGSWGYSPTVRHWIKFTAWATEALKSKTDLRNPALTPSDWYNSKTRSGICPGPQCMWTMLHIKYVSLHSDKYTVYLRAPDNKTMGSNWKEPGMNFNKKVLIPDHESVSVWDSSMDTFPEKPLVLGWDGTVAKSFVEYAKEISHAGGPVAVQFYNKAFVNMVKHWICNAEYTDGDLLSRTLFVATDHSAYIAIKQFRNNVHAVYEEQPSKQLLEFGTVDYYKLILWRTKRVSELVQEGINILIAEPDAVWLKNPFTWFGHDDYRDADVLVVDNNPPKQVLNGGFILLRNTSRTRRAWESILEKHTTLLAPFQDSDGNEFISNAGNEQTLIQSVFTADSDLKLGWLSSEIICSGKWYDDTTHPHCPGIILFNWVIGLKAKIERAKRFGHWFYNPASDTCRS